MGGAHKPWSKNHGFFVVLDKILIKIVKNQIYPLKPDKFGNYVVNLGKYRNVEKLV